MNSFTKKPVKQALVLGCGGVAGGAWTIAALAALQEQLQWDAREADVLVGTSVGAVLAALLGAGIGVERMLASQHGEATDCRWNHDTDTGGALPPWPALRFTGATLALQGLLGRATPLTAVCGLVPAGRFDMAPFRRLIDDAVQGNHWVRHPATWIMAVDTQSGRRVAFGAPTAPDASITDAVCASYGVPMWCPPVTIGGRVYIDGGVASPISADLLAESDVDEVIILAPMASTYPDRPRSLLEKVERRARRMMTGIVDREVRLLQAAGKRVVRIEPGPDDLRAFGFNMMDPARRRQVFATALRTAPDTVAQALAQAEISAGR